MYGNAQYFIFTIAGLILASFNALAENGCLLDAKQGIGALGRIEPRSRVIKISHNAGPEGARVEQLFFEETDPVKSGDTLALLSDHFKKKAQVEAAKARIKVLEAQRAVEQAALAFNKREYLRHQSLELSSATSVSLADSKRLAFEQSQINLKRLMAEIAQARSEQKIDEAELGNTRITAPIAEPC